MERSRHVLPLEPAAAHTAGALIITFVFGFRFLWIYHAIIRSVSYLIASELKHIIAPKEHLRPTGMMFVRACVRVYVTLENIVHSISRGRIVTKC